MKKLPSTYNHLLYNTQASRQLESLLAATVPSHTLMQRAGLAVARLSLALAPHAQNIWIACGPGNNGGDGLEAAMHLHHQWGKTVTVTHARSSTLPSDAQASLERALAAGIKIAAQPPENFDFCIDALLGLGGRRAIAPTSPISQWLERMHHSMVPLLAVDMPTGLNADTGVANPEFIATPSRKTGVKSRFTLSLLTLKPGLFTAEGPDLAGQVWFDDLGTAIPTQVAPSAQLLGSLSDQQPSRPHASHKGSFGDVAVIGGHAQDAHASLCGAALLAARAALHAGAGRVFVSLLGAPTLNVDPVQPELMFRSLSALDLARQVVVCGCGGGPAIQEVLPQVLSLAHRLVLDADALNAIATDSQLQTQLAARHQRGYSTVLTPHPLEAARLSASSVTEVQADRLSCAQQLADRFSCVVVLKGCGSVIAAPGQLPAINPSGNARLATAGTGDVLAGMIGSRLARGSDAWTSACSAVFQHGQLADDWSAQRPLTASTLARS